MTYAFSYLPTSVGFKASGLANGYLDCLHCLKHRGVIAHAAARKHTLRAASQAGLTDLLSSLMDLSLRLLSNALLLRRALHHEARRDRVALAAVAVGERSPPIKARPSGVRSTPPPAAGPRLNGSTPALVLSAFGGTAENFYSL